MRRKRRGTGYDLDTVQLTGRSSASRRGRLVDYGAALEMRFGATRRGFESRPLRHSVAARTPDARVVACGPRSRTLECARSGARRRLRLDARPAGASGTVAELMTDMTDARDRPARAGDVPVSGAGAGASQGVVVGYAVRHAVAILLFDTGFGFGNDGARRALPPASPGAIGGRPGRRPGSRSRTSTAVANCHLHADHAGQNPRSRTSRSTSRPTEWEIAHTTDHTILDWIDFPAPATASSPATTSRSTGIRIVATPGPHARSPVARRRHRRRPGRPRRPGRLHGSSEWAGEPDAARGPDRRAPIARPTTARSSACTRLEPSRSGSATTGGPGAEPRPDVGRSDPRYPSGAVLGGELAVPCTCNPLQQG